MSRLVNPRHLVALLSASCLVLLLAAPSVAQPDVAADPTTAAMTLAPADFPDGAKVAKQRYEKAVAPATSTYTREFRPGARVGITFLLVLDTEVSLFPRVADAADEVKKFRRLATGKANRTMFANELARGFKRGSKVKLKRVALSQPVSLGSGQSSVHVSATFVLGNGRDIAMHFALVQTDRSVAFMFAIPLGPRFPKADLRALAKLQSDRLLKSFTVANLAVPTVTGTASPGQTLTASSGDWSGAPSTYTYQWSRCDSTATTCTDIPGATSATYVVAAEDTGSTLRTTVVAGNSVGSVNATSAVTTAVA